MLKLTVFVTYISLISISGSLYNLTLTKDPVYGLCINVSDHSRQSFGYSPCSDELQSHSSFEETLFSSNYPDAQRMLKNQEILAPIAWGGYGLQLGQFLCSLFFPICTNSTTSKPRNPRKNKVKLIAPCRSLCRAAEKEYATCLP